VIESACKTIVQARIKQAGTGANERGPFQLFDVLGPTYQFTFGHLPLLSMTCGVADRSRLDEFAPVWIVSDLATVDMVRRLFPVSYFAHTGIQDFQRNYRGCWSFAQQPYSGCNKTGNTSTTHREGHGVAPQPVPADCYGSPYDGGWG
jgi:hypothetical protein